MICSNEYEQSDWDEEIRGVFDSKGDRRPQTDINNGEQRLFDISSASTSGVWVWTVEIETLIDIATLRRRVKSFEDYEVVSAQLLAFARLQSLI